MVPFGVTTGLHGVSLARLPSMGGVLVVPAPRPAVKRQREPFRKAIVAPLVEGPRRPRTSRMMRMWKAGRDTVEIAAVLGRTEASVSKRLWIEREALRAWEAENAGR